MSRTLRAQMPGMAFHLTARIVRKDPLFVGVEAVAEKIIVEGVTSSDALLLSHVVMPNHFHIILRQGRRPLGWIMQPIMRRLALLVQRSQGIQGHVFERRFRSLTFDDAVHLRRSIVYSDMNPQRAGLCEHPSQYLWGSHVRLVRACDTADTRENLLTILKLFAQTASDDLEYLRAAYMKHIEWRIKKDAHDRAGTVFDEQEPSADYGDRHFATTFRLIPCALVAPRLDLRDRAVLFLEKIDKECAIDQLRRRTLSRRLSPIRDQLIAALLQADYQNVKVANFLKVSDSKVSQIAIAMRYGMCP
jgi:putative transposase